MLTRQLKSGTLKFDMKLMLMIRRTRELTTSSHQRRQDLECREFSFLSLWFHIDLCLAIQTFVLRFSRCQWILVRLFLCTLTYISILIIMGPAVETVASDLLTREQASRSCIMTMLADLSVLPRTECCRSPNPATQFQAPSLKRVRLDLTLDSHWCKASR